MSPGKPSRFQKMPTVNFKSPQKFSKTLTQDSFLQDSIYNQRCETEIFNSECKDSIFEPKISNEVNNKSIFGISNLISS